MQYDSLQLTFFPSERQNRFPAHVRPVHGHPARKRKRLLVGRVALQPEEEDHGEVRQQEVSQRQAG